MYKKRMLFIILSFVTISLAFSGCAKKSVKTDKAKVEKIVENGVGKDKKFDDALDLAFRDALKKVVVGIIGEGSEKANKDKLKSYMYGISESFILSYEITDKVKADKDTIVYISAVLNKTKVEETLNTIGIEIPEEIVEKDYSESPYAGLINEALDNLTYLVYFEPEKK